MPVTVVSTSLATVAMAVFMTVVSSAITNCPVASVMRISPVAPARPAETAIVLSTLPSRSARARGRDSRAP